MGEFSNVERRQTPKELIAESSNHKKDLSQKLRSSNLLKEEEDDSDTGEWIVDALAVETVHFSPSNEEDNGETMEIEKFNFRDNTKSGLISSRLKSSSTRSDRKKKIPSITITASLFGSKTNEGSTTAPSTARLPLSSDAVRRAAAAAGRSAESSQKEKKKQLLTLAKPSRQRISDRDGGAGVLGRLRAATSENFLSRQLMGAYPGDALPIEEAGDERGLFDLARKYGYGELLSATRDEEKRERGKINKKNHQQKVETTYENYAPFFGLENSLLPLDDSSTGSIASIRSRSNEDSQNKTKDSSKNSSTDQQTLASRVSSSIWKDNFTKAKSPLLLGRGREMEVVSSAAQHLEQLKKKHRKSKLPLKNIIGSAENREIKTSFEENNVDIPN